MWLDVSLRGDTSAEIDMGIDGSPQGTAQPEPAVAPNLGPTSRLATAQPVDRRPPYLIPTLDGEGLRAYALNPDMGTDGLMCVPMAKATPVVTRGFAMRSGNGAIPSPTPSQY